MHDVYAFGVIAPSTLLVLEDDYPPSGGYAEIAGVYPSFGGEAAGGGLGCGRSGVGGRCCGGGKEKGDQGREHSEHCGTFQQRHQKPSIPQNAPLANHMRVQTKTPPSSW